ncbi:hypothetical protein THITH_04915 [Thioalkalivibrio paradoxus ARh 1]|uniref:ATP-grasp domain-containing protein n=1 Tax=Thioalkalivibrio paradoxus ARh 1 TaxID=713585 RepID=W0DRR3_9GAMM|nr:hypothetical protein THITH_04915 [Thioalkalivibrio paradoxus ARh 1]
MLLSGGSLVGQNIIAALSQRRDQLDIRAVNSKADEPTLFDFDAVYLAPWIGSDPGAFEQRFDAIVEEAAPDLVIPCRDDDVAFLAARAQRDPNARSRYLCGSRSIADALSDKWESWRFSSALGLPFAPTLRADCARDELDAFVHAHGFPLVAKPVSGFASRGVVLVLDREQLARLVGRNDYIFQKFLGDPDRVRAHAQSVARDGVPLFHTFEEVKHSIQGCIAPEGRISGLMVTDNLMRFGRSERVDLATDPELESAGMQWVRTFAEAGWRGPLNIQCQRGSDGRLAIYEYNGRFTGATAARYLLGFDEVGMVVRDWLAFPLRVDAPPPGARSVIRTMNSRMLDPGKVTSLSRTLSWRP